MNDELVKLIISNLKNEISKDEVKSILEEKNISIKEYNNLIMEILANSNYKIEYESSKALLLDELLDDPFKRELLEFKRQEDDIKAEQKTLYELKPQLSEVYKQSNYKSCKIKNGLLSTGEILTKFKEYSKEFGMDENISIDCAELIRKGIEMYLKDLSSDCDGKISVESLKKAISKRKGIIGNVLFPN